MQGTALFKTENQTVVVLAGILSAACFDFMATLANRLADSIQLAGIVACVLAAQYLLTVSFAKLSLPLATALGPSCIVWTVLGVALFQSTMPTFHAILGVTVYTIGTGLMIWGSTKASASVPNGEP